MTAMEVFVEYLVKTLVDHPESVAIASTMRDEGVHIEVKVDPKDAGMVIGRRGYVIRSIRMLASVMARNEHQKVFVDIVPLEGVA